MSVSNGHVLVTGAAMRIGRVIALHMAMAGWDVAVHYHTSHEEAEDVVRAIRALGRKAHLAQADFANTHEVEALIPSITADAGPLTALVNNSSLFERDKSDPTGSRHRAVNYEAPCRLSEHFQRQLPPGEMGSIVNLLEATPIPASFSAYLTSKKLLRKATLALARSMAPRVRVNAVALGAVLMNQRESREHFERLIEATPLKVETSPKAVAATVLFLIENPAITGEIIFVDGGAHLRRSKR